MQVRDFQRLYDYNYWANKRLFAAMVTLTPEEFVRPLAGSYGSVRNTLVHVLSAEWGWLDRCGGHPRGPKLNADNYPTLDSVVSAWSSVDRHMREFLSGLSDADLARQVEFSFSPEKKHSKSVAHLLQHAANHGAHHRGQIALLLRMLGHVPGDFDYLLYDGESTST